MRALSPFSLSPGAGPRRVDKLYTVFVIFAVLDDVHFSHEMGKRPKGESRAFLSGYCSAGV